MKIYNLYYYSGDESSGSFETHLGNFTSEEKALEAQLKDMETPDEWGEYTEELGYSIEVIKINVLRNLQ